MERLTYMERGCCQVKGADNLLCSEVCEIPAQECQTCPINKAFLRLKAYEDTGLTPDEITTMAQEIETRFLLYFERIYGPNAGKLLSVLEAAKQGRVVIVPRPGDVLYETDPAHGVVKHTVTDVHWVANTSAVDDDGQTWADYYADEDIETAHHTREAAEAVLQPGEG